jgi:ABC-type uncharacterized transport system ATPase subunit
MTQAEEICQHVVMIHRGRKVLDEGITAIRRQYDPRAIRFEPLDPSADPTVLQSLAEVERVDRVDGSYDIHLVAGTDPGSAMQRITMAIAPARIELSRPRLEDVFIGIVSDGTGTSESDRKLRADLRDLGASGAAV